MLDLIWATSIPPGAALVQFGYDPVRNHGVGKHIVVSWNLGHDAGSWPLNAASLIKGQSSINLYSLECILCLTLPEYTWNTIMILSYDVIYQCNAYVQGQCVNHHTSAEALQPKRPIISRPSSSHLYCCFFLLHPMLPPVSFSPSHPFHSVVLSPAPLSLLSPPFSLRLPFLFSL